MGEVKELFEGWGEYPPTNILVKALVEGFGGKTSSLPSQQEIPPAAMEEMQRSALAAIAIKAGPRLPIVRGKDKGLPKAPPVFDLDELRRRNANVGLKGIAQ